MLATSLEQLSQEEKQQFERDVAELEQARRQWSLRPTQDPIGTPLREEAFLERRWGELGASYSQRSQQERMALRKRAEQLQETAQQRKKQEIQRLKLTKRAEFEQKRQEQIRSGIITPKPRPKPEFAYFGTTERTIIGLSPALVKKYEKVEPEDITYITAEDKTFGLSPGAYEKFEQVVRRQEFDIKRQEQLLSGKLEPKGIIPKIQTISARFLAKYERLEEQVKYKTTYPLARKIAMKTHLTLDTIIPSYFKTTTDVGMKRIEKIPFTPFDVKPIGIEKATGEFAVEYIKSLKERPIRAGVTFATFFILPPVSKGIGIALRTTARVTGISRVALKISPKIAKVTMPISKAITKGITKIGVKPEAVKELGKVAKGIASPGTLLTGAYVGTIGYEVYATPPGERAKKLGEVSALDITPMILGGYTGAKFFARASTWTKLGGTELKLKDITPPEYYEKLKIGKPGIPKEPVVKHKLLFESKKYAPKDVEKAVGYHLYGETPVGTYRTITGEKRFKVLSRKELAKLGVKTKPREAEALYISPYPSVHFARITEREIGFYGGKLLDPYGTPGGFVVEPTKFKIASIIKTPKIKTIGVKLGEAGVPGVIIKKQEPQALIPPGTELKFGKRYYFKYKGYKVVLPKLEAIDKKVARDVAKRLAKIDKLKLDISSSYYRGKIAYATTPESYAVGSYLRSILSKPSIPISKVSAYKVSKISKPSISKISKLVSKISSKVSKVSVSKVAYTSYLPYPYRPKTPYSPYRVRPYRAKVAYPKIPPILRRKARLKKAIRIKKEYQQAYTPGFTSRILQLQAKITKKQLAKLPKFTFTGLEVRPGLKVLQ